MPIQQDIPDLFVNFKYPEYEVITPQTKRKIRLRTLTVDEEERLKTSNVTMLGLPSFLNSIIYDCIVNKEPPLDTYEGFLKNITTIDRDALMHGLYVASYRELQEYKIKCLNPRCGTEYEVNVDLNSIAEINFYNGKKDFLKREVIIEELPQTKVQVVLKQPTLFDEERLYQSFEQSRVNISKLTKFLDELYIKSLTVQSDKGPITITAPLDIDMVISKLPSIDKKVINKKIREEFANYNITLKLKTKCPTCGTENENIVDLVTEFFRMAFS